MASGLTIHEASGVTGWSARMLRYIEESGLVVPSRSPGGYRLFGPAELQRLRTLRDLLEAHGVDLAEVGFALRLRSDRSLRGAIDGWLSADGSVIYRALDLKVGLFRDAAPQASEA